MDPVLRNIKCIILNGEYKGKRLLELQGDELKQTFILLFWAQVRRYSM